MRMGRDSDDHRGAQRVAGRMTALAADGSTLYAGAADGGVWKKVGTGAWQPLTDDSPTLSIGALTVDPSHGLWVGTGEANTNSDSYAGVGVLFSSDGGANFSRVGGDELNNHTIGRLVYDNGFVLAATSQGLFRHSATIRSGPWTSVLAAGVGLPATCSQSGGIEGAAFVSDVAVKPGSAGKVVDAVVGWRAGSNCNGFFQSNNGGQTFAPRRGRRCGQRQRPRPGDDRVVGGRRQGLRARPVGIDVQPREDRPRRHQLQGVYASNGNFAGPWNKIAEWRNLQNSGSALKNKSKGYHPGVQAWYNQFLGRRPRQREPPVPRARRGLRDHERWRQLARRRTVLELRPALRRQRSRQLPAHDPSGSARGHDRNGTGVRR